MYRHASSYGQQEGGGTAVGQAANSWAAPVPSKYSNSGTGAFLTHGKAIQDVGKHAAGLGQWESQMLSDAPSYINLPASKSASSNALYSGYRAASVTNHPKTTNSGSNAINPVDYIAQLRRQSTSTSNRGNAVAPTVPPTQHPPPAQQAMYHSYGGYFGAQAPSQMSSGAQAYPTGMQYNLHAPAPIAKAPPAASVNLAELQRRQQQQQQQTAYSSVATALAQKQQLQPAAAHATSLYGKFMDQANAAAAAPANRYQLKLQAELAARQGGHGLSPEEMHKKQKQRHDAPGSGSSSQSTATDYLDCDEEVEDIVCSPVYTREAAAFALMAEVSVYSDHSSPKALKIANNIMCHLRLPGHGRFMPVDELSTIFRMGSAWGFTAFSIALGSSYFQRLLSVNPHLESAVRCNDKYREYVDYMKDQTMRVGSVAASVCAAQDSTLQSIQFCCVYLAQKITDAPPSLDMLRYMLTNIYGALVTRDQAYEVEVKCLEGLQWRLGPYFQGDCLDVLLDDC